MRKLILPLIAGFIFISESLFVNIFLGDLLISKNIFVPHFIMIFLMFLAVYGTRRTALVYALILGIMFDVVYTEVLGIYLFAFPVITFLFSSFMKVLQNNILIVSIMTLLSIAILEVTIFQMNLIIGVASMSYHEFATVRLLPTLALNAAAVVIFSYPLKKQIEKLQLEGLRD
ncbi:rod shape-determining protein MreD [Peribacillus acanthi]|uniref:rod shape-determining protein MreD n=1 Tax=Peribacillus acanthi TaxID=2171554 RepID=UPI000D3E62A3|nr:rod shape-determining protein MreD [Peribacillus acanthi]